MKPTRVRFLHLGTCCAALLGAAFLAAAGPPRTGPEMEKRFPYSKYVIFDPAAGLNSYSVMGDWYSSAGYEFKTELSFAQNFKGGASDVFRGGSVLDEFGKNFFIG